MSNPFQKASRSQVKANTTTRYTVMSVAERIYACSISTDSGCWEWARAVGKNGYGLVTIGKGNQDYAHRASYAAFNGPIPKGMDVCHSCDNRKCVKPGHLFVGTRKQNMEDCARNNRVNRTVKARGEKQHLAKLTDESVREIKAKLSDGKSCYSLGKLYGVARITISRIKNGKTWRHIQ